MYIYIYIYTYIYVYKNIYITESVEKYIFVSDICSNTEENC